MSKRKASITQRQRRLLVELLNGPVTRRQANEITGALNSPEIVGQLRKRHGIPVAMRKVRHIDRDKRPTAYGEYSLDKAGMEAARRLLQMEQA